MPKGGQTSVFRIGGLTESKVSEVGQREVGKQRNFHGWGVFIARAIPRVGLRLDPDDTPPRHANIVGWPDNDDKDAVIEKAQDLAALASDLVLRR